MNSAGAPGTGAVPSLGAFRPGRKFLVGVDSDGCALDSMNLKHRRCFFPALVSVYRLQPIADEALRVWESVNLYSPYRGANRFRALALAFGELRKLPGVDPREYPQLDAGPLVEWIDDGGALSAEALQAWMRDPAEGPAKSREGRSRLQDALEWSREVNRLAREHSNSGGIRAFDGVEETLRFLKTAAEVVVISQASTDALREEWNRVGLDAHLDAMAGQEFGSKTRQLQAAMAHGYSGERTLLIGDAPGDWEAARDCGALFYPIHPGREEASWERLREEAGPRFFTGRYAGTYARGLAADFRAVLGI